MEYIGSYGHVVTVNVDRDLEGNKINQKLKYVVTFYLDNDAGLVGIYPLEKDGYSRAELINFQPVKHEVLVEDLQEA